MISCAEAVRRLWEYVDGNLDEVDRALVEEHLDRCRRCCGEFEFGHELRRLLRDAADEPVPDDVVRRLSRTLEGLEP